MMASMATEVFSGLAVADNQFALAAPDGNNRVHGFDAGLQRLFHAFALHHAGRFDFNQAALVGDNRAFAVNRFAQRVHHAANQRATNRHIGDATGGFHGVAFSDVSVGTGDDGHRRCLLQG